MVEVYVEYIFMIGVSVLFIRVLMALDTCQKGMKELFTKVDNLG